MSKFTNRILTISFTLFLILLIGCVPVQTSSNYQSKRLVFDNYNYESIVGLVQIFPASENPQAALDYPAVQLESTGIKMSFDLLEENYRYIQARFIHCNADWSRSQLADIQFLDSYNEFTINDYEYSSNTRIPYVQYDILLPVPKISGNYLVAVYHEGDEQDLLFVRRIIVYAQKATIDAAVVRSDIVAERQSNQQIEFTVNYKGITNPNPIQDFKVTILQNHNWNTALTDLKPTLVRNDQKYMEYKHFGGENNFKGWTEFRFFDIRTIDYRGINVAQIEKEPTGVQAYLNPDKSRGNLAYTQINEDLNGNYYLENTDPGDAPNQSEYVDVHFTLETEQIDGDVFINGQLSNWELGTRNLMVYDPVSQSYKGSMLLKQGYYDYLYWVQSDFLSADHFEGSDFQTQNDYELLLYYRDPARNYDQLIGYKKLLSRN